MKIIEIIKYNIKRIVEVWIKIMGMVFSILSVVLSFVAWEEIGCRGATDKILFFICIILCSVVFAALWICFLKRESIVYKVGRKEICVRYGDILKLGFPRKCKGKRIVVIPVNTGFDTIVDETIPNNQRPLISTETIHGKWILKYCEKEMGIDELDKKIEQTLQNETPVKKLKCEDVRRKLENYELGTVVPIESGDVIFFLMALSRFDQNNNAHSSREEVIQCAESMLKYYYEKGQGYDLYLPLIGTGMSGAGLSPSDSLRLLKALLELNLDIVRGKVNIVISQEQKGEVSIFD
ncbi:MAG: DUF6430 domain-containing protein [Roseburia sp.]|nr:DUF6430 domain-containing protein [Roseburia sp.]